MSIFQSFEGLKPVLSGYQLLAQVLYNMLHNDFVHTGHSWKWLAWAIRVGGSVSMIFQSCIKGEVRTHNLALWNMIQGWSWMAVKTNQPNIHISVTQPNDLIHALAGWDLTPGLTLMHRKCPAPQEVAPQGIRGAALVGFFCPFNCELWMLAYSPKQKDLNHPETIFCYFSNL